MVSLVAPKSTLHVHKIESSCMRLQIFGEVDLNMPLSISYVTGENESTVWPGMIAELILLFIHLYCIFRWYTF